MYERMYERMYLLPKKDMQKIHEATIEILGTIGVAFHSAEALEVFRQHGVTVENQTVFLEEEHIETALQTAPHSFQIRSRNFKKSVRIGGSHLVMAPGYGASFIVDSNGERRDALMQDYINFCKLVHTSDYIGMNGCLMVDPSDIPSDTSHLDMLFSSAVLSDKPFLGAPTSKQAALDSIEMANILWGGGESLNNKPVMMAIISALSPLQYSADMADALIEFARAGQAVMVGGLMQAGSTGPVSLPGLLTLHNAEILAGIVLAQMVNAGTPVVYGTTSSITEMKSGSLTIGAPELSMIQNASIQMARFYKLPRRGTGGVTDAHFPDAQAGVESALSLTMTIMSGANFILHACGILGSYLAMSYEKFLIDEETFGMILRILEPLTVTDERISLDVIKEVGIGGEYLTHFDTFQKYRKEFFNPSLMSRASYDKWTTSEKRRLDEVATAKLGQRLEKYRKPDIDPKIEKDLLAYVALKKKEQPKSVNIFVPQGQGLAVRPTQ